MRELEVKILNIDLNQMEEKIKKLGGKLIAKEVQVNTLIDSKDKYIEKNLDSYLRIRETRSILEDSIKYTLTMKKNVEREAIRENIETNIDISDREAMIKLLENLGYFVYQEGYKERTSYMLEGARLDLDTWDKDTYPYPYMEIEVKSEGDLEHMINKLSIFKENISTKSILELRNELKLL
ncbi:MAG TPA: class IV adenylate cyclase [Tissierellaceae bacterium]|nr:class IV adenylate cyclase [Tissierellaceae bacterium]